MTRNGGISVRVWIICCAFVAIVSGSVTEAIARGHAEIFFVDISEETLGDAARELAQQTGKQLLFSNDLADVSGVRPVKGRYSVENALELMLQDLNDLSGGLTKSGVITISLREQGQEGDSMTNNRRWSLLAGISALAQAAFSTSGVQAQDQERAQGYVTEVIVTARKREENLQDIPVSVTAFGSELIERGNIDNLSDIAALTPGLVFQDFGAGSLKTPTIRGLAQTNVAGKDGNVGIFLDGFFLPSRNTVDIGIIDLERIEVVKGPQNALYGRNTFAGAINYVSREPGDTFEGSASASVGTDEFYEVKGSVGGPIVEDILKAQLSLGYKEFDGTFENLADGENVQGYENFDAMGTLILTPTEDLSIKLMGYYGDHDAEQNAIHMVESNCPGSAPTYFCGTLPFKEKVNLDPDAFGSKNEIALGGLTIEYETDYLTFTSLTSVSHSDAISLTDNDANADGLLYSGLDTSSFPPSLALVNARSLLSFEEEANSWSQEFRVSSPQEDRFSWLAGAFFYNAEFEDASYAAVDTTAADAAGVSLLACGLLEPVCTPNPLGVIFDAPSTSSESETDIWALYAQGSFDVTDRLTVAAEVRYTHEEKETTTFTNFAFVPVAMPVASKESWNFLAPRFTVDFAMNDDVLLYASAAKGVKSGGFNAAFSPLFPDEATFDEETNWTYEAGVKTTLFGGRVLANASVFYIDWDDVQIPSASQDATFLQAVTRNLGTAESTGVELEITAAVSDNVTIGGTYAYTNPEYDEAVDLGLARVCVDPTFCSTDVSGRQLGRTVENTFTAFVDFTAPLANGLEIFGRADYSYQDESPSRPLGLQFLDERSLVNAKVGINSDAWELSLWAKNLFDEEYVTSQIRQPRLSDFTSPTTVLQGDGRVVGLTGTIRF